MANSKVSLALKKDREIREARFGFALAAWLFGIWSALRLPTFFIFFAPEFGPFEKVLHVLFTVFVIGITFLAIKRYIDLGKLREKFSKDPEKYKNVKIEGPPVLTTIIPFLLK